jgi:hypothetical protein
MVAGEEGGCLPGSQHYRQEDVKRFPHLVYSRLPLLLVASQTIIPMVVF